MAKETSELLLLEEVAQEMRTTVWAVRAWIKAGKLPALRPGKRLLVRRTDVTKMMGAVVVHPANNNATGSHDCALSAVRKP